MPQVGLIFRVLVASPSDCIKERALVPEIIYAWNAAHSWTSRAILEPVLWETHARPEIGGRPQALVNKQLVENCDILIGTFWTRLGTHTGKAESGTAEEIEEFRSMGKPVLLYFSSAPVAPQSLDPEQYRALAEYKEKLGHQALYFGYETIGELRDLIQGHIAGTMAILLAQPSLPAAAEKPSQQQMARDFLTNFNAFLRMLDAEWASERDSDPHGTDDGKAILGRALNEVLSFRSQIASGGDGAARMLSDAAKEMRSLQRMSLYMDGGISFRAFWSQGDALIERLRAVPAAIAAIQGDADQREVAAKS
jgi:hypothetical protein